VERGSGRAVGCEIAQTSVAKIFVYEYVDVRGLGGGILWTEGLVRTVWNRQSGLEYATRSQRVLVYGSRVVEWIFVSSQVSLKTYQAFGAGLEGYAPVVGRPEGGGSGFGQAPDWTRRY